MDTKGDLIHRLMHRTLPLHPRDGVIGACSHAGLGVLRVGSRQLICLPVSITVRADPALVSFVVSFSHVRNRSVCPTEHGQPRLRTVATCAVPLTRTVRRTESIR